MNPVHAQYVPQMRDPLFFIFTQSKTQKMRVDGFAALGSYGPWTSVWTSEHVPIRWLSEWPGKFTPDAGDCLADSLLCDLYRISGSDAHSTESAKIMETPKTQIPQQNMNKEQ